MQQFDNLAEAQVLALAIVEALPDPLVVLDGKMQIIAASNSFYRAFDIDPAGAHGRSLFEVGDGRWDLPDLRNKLAKVFLDRGVMQPFEAQQNLAGLGARTILLNARLVAPQTRDAPTLLLGFEDITARRVIEHEKEDLLEQTADLVRQQRVLYREMQHRVANSLQIIASILMLKARAVASQEARDHLKDAHQRVLSVAEVQAHLNSAEGIEQIGVASYLTKLCKGLAASMIGPERPIGLVVTATEGTLDSSRAVSLGLIVTELVINAIKHAFPFPGRDACIHVTYEADDLKWQLTISDNGVGTGRPNTVPSGGLGTAIVAALANQLQANITATATDAGRTVHFGPAPVGQPLPLAA